MNDYGRRIVIDLGFETALSETSRAIREEGLQMLARIDVRDRFWRDLAHDFRRYYLLEAWSPELALEALRNNLEVGTILSTTFAIYELADGETVVVAKESFSQIAADPDWRRDAPAVAAVVDREGLRVARVLERLRRVASREASVWPAA
jgi:uncharacterized protein (DUF302 family)